MTQPKQLSIDEAKKLLLERFTTRGFHLGKETTNLEIEIMADKISKVMVEFAELYTSNANQREGEVYFVKRDNTIPKESGCYLTMAGYKHYSVELKRWTNFLAHKPDNQDSLSISTWYEELTQAPSINGIKWRLTESFVKDVLAQYTKEEISFGKMVELFNEKFSSTPSPIASADEKGDLREELLKWVEKESAEASGEYLSVLIVVKEKLLSHPSITKESDAVKFAEWIKKSDWQEGENGWDRRAGNYIHGILLETITTKQLYDLFKNPQPTKV